MKAPRTMHVFYVLCALLVLSGAAFAQGGQCTSDSDCLYGARCSGGSCVSISGQILNLNFGALPAWLPLFAIFLFIGYAIASIAYMISSVFRLSELSVWAKTEVAEVTASAFLVLIILIALGMADGIYAAATNGMTPMDMSLSFTSNIANKLFGVYMDSVWLTAAVGTLTGAPPQYTAAGGTEASKNRRERIASITSSVMANMPGSGLRFLMFTIFALNVNYYPFWSLSTFTAHFGTVQSIALTSIFISIVSNMVLSFIQSVALPVMVPFGFFLSMFSLTRRMGRTLIAFGVGLYLFFPASIIISQTMYNYAYKSNTNPVEIPMPSSAADLTSSLMGIQIQELIIATVGILIIMLTSLAGSLMFIPSCTLGSLFTASLECLVSCAASGPGYGFCLAACIAGKSAAYTFICSQVTVPMDSFPASKNLGLILLGSVINSVRLISLDSALDAGTPFGYILGASAQGMVAAAGLATALFWHIIPFPFFYPRENLIMKIAEIASIPLGPISAYSSFIAHKWLNEAAAVKMTDITLEFTPYVMQYAVPILLMPLVILLVVVTGIRSISPAIGGEVQILGVTELI